MHLHQRAKRAIIRSSDDTLISLNKQHAIVRAHSQVDQQFYNQTTKNVSEFKPEYLANKNKIRKPLIFHLFILNILVNLRQKQANAISYSHYEAP